MKFSALMVGDGPFGVQLYALAPIGGEEFRARFSAGEAACFKDDALVRIRPTSKRAARAMASRVGASGSFVIDPSIKTSAAKALLKSLSAFYFEYPFSDTLAFAIADAVGEEHWGAARLVADGDPEEGVVLRLIRDIQGEASRKDACGGYGPGVSLKEAKALRRQAGLLARTLRGLPELALSDLASRASIRDPAEVFIPKLQRLSEATKRWVNEGTTVEGFVTARRAKAVVEDAIAYTIASYGIPLTRYRRSDTAKGGTLDRVLRVAYQFLGMKAGADTMPILRRLTTKWTAEAVALEAARRNTRRTQRRRARSRRR